MVRWGNTLVSEVFLLEINQKGIKGHVQGHLKHNGKLNYKAFNARIHKIIKKDLSSLIFIFPVYLGK